MATILNPYLGFLGEAREALAFYATVFGGTTTLMTYAEGGMPHAPGQENLVMHGQLTSPDGFTLMVSDGPEGATRSTDGYSISLSGDEAETLRGFWDKLAAGGSIAQPLVEAPWGDWFGMVTDRFGVAWMVNITVAR